MLGHDLFGCFPAQRLSWPAVEQAGDIVERGLAQRRQIGALGQELAQQSVGVLVAAALPGGMRIGEPDVELEPLGEFTMTGHLGTAVIGQALAQEGGQFAQLTAEALKGILGRAAFHLAEHDKARVALDQGAHGRAVEGAFDEVAFPVTGHLTVSDLLGAMDDAKLLGDEAARRGGCASPAPSGRLGLAQGGDHLGLERTARMRVDGPIDRLGADLALAVIRVHATQSGSDLLRRPEPVAQTVSDPLPQPVPLDDLVRPNAGATSPLITTGSLSCPVAAGRTRTASAQFTTDRRGRPIQPARNRSYARSSLGFYHDRRALFGAQVFVLSFQGNLRAGRECCTCKLSLRSAFWKEVFLV